MATVDHDGLDGTFRAPRARPAPTLRPVPVLVPAPVPVPVQREVQLAPRTRVSKRAFDRGSTLLLANTVGSPATVAEAPTRILEHEPPPPLRRPASPYPMAVAAGLAVCAMVGVWRYVLFPHRHARPLRVVAQVVAQPPVRSPAPPPKLIVTPLPVPLEDAPVPVTFEHNQEEARIDEAAFTLFRQTLGERCSGRMLILTGHTCERGDEDDNRRVGLARADSVRRRLIDYGVEESRLDVRSAGSAMPIASNRSSAGRRQNRRVTITCQPAPTEVP
jgi:hypothetical protein